MDKSQKFRMMIYLVLMLLSINLVFAADFFCSSCADCNTQLQSMNSGDVLKLTSDISNQDGTCIDFDGKDDVIFDCQDFTIDGDDDIVGYGINLTSESNNNTIKNCVITEFGFGILISYSGNNSIINISFNYNYHTGIMLYFADSNYFSDVIVENDINVLIYGISMSFSNNNVFVNISSIGGYQGLVLQNATGNTFIDVVLKEYSITDISIQNQFGQETTVVCDNKLVNITGSGDRPIGWYNYSVNLHDKVFSQLILCDASNSNLTNITIKGSDTLNNSQLSVYFTNNSNFIDIYSSNNHAGPYLVSSNFNNLKNIITDFNIAVVGLTNSNYNNLSNIIASMNLIGLGLSDDSDYNIITNSTIFNSINHGLYLGFNSAYGVYPEYNLFYNNFFNNSQNVEIKSGILNPNYLSVNIDCAVGPNIINGSCIGGNLWAQPNGAGFSQTCSDSNDDGICDDEYNLSSGSSVAIDYYPLFLNGSGVSPPPSSPPPSGISELIAIPSIVSDGSTVYFYYTGEGLNYDVTINNSELLKLDDTAIVTLTLKDDGIYPDESVDDNVYTVSYDIGSGNSIDDGNISLSARIDTGSIIKYANATVRLDNSGPELSIVINDYEPASSSRFVTLTLTYSDANGISNCRYGSSLGEIAVASWETCTTTKPYVLKGAAGNKSIYYQVRDNAGNIRLAFDEIKYLPQASISSVECFDNTDWINCTDISYGMYLDSIRVNCTGNSEDVLNVFIRLRNSDDDFNLIEGSAIPQEHYWQYDYKSWITDSGTYNLTVRCVTPLFDDTYMEKIVVPFGNPNLPISPRNVSQNQLFSISPDVRCRYAECGDLSVELMYNDSFFSVNNNVLNKTLYPCLENMDKDDTCQLNWDINATGNLNTTSEFYLEAESSYLYTVESDKVNITITIPRPIIISPNGGELVRNSYNITWNIPVGFESENLSYELSYSSDDGMNWEILNITNNQTHYLWDTINHSNSVDAMLRVRAILNGTYGIFDYSDSSFTVDNIAYVLTIVTPRNDEFISGITDINMIVPSYAKKVTFGLSNGTDSFMLNGSVGLTTDEDISDGWSNQINTSLFRDGEYNLTINIYDKILLLFDSLIVSGSIIVNINNDNPEPPTNLILSESYDLDNNVTLSWQPSNSSDLDSYRVYRSISPGFDHNSGTLIAIVNTISLEQHMENGKYYYKVTAVDTGGKESVPSNEVTLIVNTQTPIGKLSTDKTYVKNNQKVQFIFTSLSAGYNVTISLDELRKLDINAQNDLSLTDMQEGVIDGIYTGEYVISNNNTISNGNVVINVSVAYELASYVISVMLKLDNTPPDNIINVYGDSGDESYSNHQPVNLELIYSDNYEVSNCRYSNEMFLDSYLFVDYFDSETYIFSNTNVTLDTSNSSIRLNDTLSGVIESNIVIETDEFIKKAIIFAREHLPVVSMGHVTEIKYYLSLDNGTTYEEVSNGEAHVFSHTGKLIRWKAEFTTSNETIVPIIYDLSVQTLSEVKWESCYSSKAWRLSDNYGIKDVYYQVKDKAGNVITANDSIIYRALPIEEEDFTPPINLTVTDDGEFSNDRHELHCSFDSFDPETFVSYKFQICEEGNCSFYPGNYSWFSSGPVSSYTVDHLRLTEGRNYTFNVIALNGDGHGGYPVMSDGIITDFTRPSTPDVTTSITNPNNWYRGDDVSFSFISNDTNGIAAYSYLLDAINSTIPDDIPEYEKDDILLRSYFPPTNHSILKTADIGNAGAIAIEVGSNISAGDILEIKFALMETNNDSYDSMEYEVYVVDNAPTDYDNLGFALSNVANYVNDLSYYMRFSDVLTYSAELNVSFTVFDGSFYVIIKGIRTDDDNVNSFAIGNYKNTDDSLSLYYCEENYQIGASFVCVDKSDELDYSVSVKLKDLGQDNLWDKYYTGLTEGDFFFHVKAIDNAGNMGETNHYNVKIDTVPPRAPRMLINEQYVSDFYAFFNWTAITDASGIYGYYLQVDNNSDFSSPLTSTGTGYVGNSTSSNVSILTGGTYYARVLVTDNAGHNSSWSDSSILVNDITPPVILSMKPDGTIVSKTAEFVIITDEYATCEYNDGGYQTFGFTGTTYHSTRVGITSGNYPIMCTDRAGNYVTDTISISSIVTNPSVSSISIQAIPQLILTDHVVAFNLSLNPAYGEIKKDRFNLEINENDHDFNIVDLGSGKYELSFISPSVNDTYQLDIYCYGATTTTEIVVENLVLSLEYISSSLSDEGQNLRVIYSRENNSLVGFASDSNHASNEMQSGNTIKMDVNAKDGTSYIIATTHYTNLDSRQKYLLAKTFEKQITPTFGYDIGYDKRTYQIHSVFSKVNVISNESFGTGRYDVLITNKGLSGGKMIVEVDII